MVIALGMYRRNPSDAQWTAWTVHIIPQGELIMKKAIVALLSMLLLPALSFAASGMRDGLWEISSRVEMPGMPMKMKPTVMKHCYSKEDVKDQKTAIAKDKNCTVTDMKTSGNKVTWAMKCSGPNAATMTGETIFGSDSYASVMHMKSEGHNMTTMVNGKRLGACP
jgi:hypothetical protein